MRHSADSRDIVGVWHTQSHVNKSFDRDNILLWGRIITLYRAKAAYSHHSNYLLVYLCVCAVHSGKTATGNQIMIWFGMVGRMDPGMRQVIGFGISPWEGVILRQMWGTRLYKVTWHGKWQFSMCVTLLIDIIISCYNCYYFFIVHYLFYR